MNTGLASQSKIIEFDSTEFGYGRRTIISQFSLTIHAGEFVGIVGPNGSGKTTIIRAIVGMLKPQKGRLTLQHADGRELRLGYVPQRDSIDLILPFTVADIVLMGRFSKIGIFGLPGAADREKVKSALLAVELLDTMNVPFKNLSGGQKQRALIARALVAEPDVLILDEPTNGMDLSSRIAILELIKTLHSTAHMTVLMVSHLLSDVANYVQTIVLLEESNYQVGPVQEILTSKNLTQIYRMPVRVGEVFGKKVIVAGHEHD